MHWVAVIAHLVVGGAEGVDGFQRDLPIAVVVTGELNIPFMVDVSFEQLEAVTRAQPRRIAEERVDVCFSKAKGRAAPIVCQALVAKEEGAPILIWIAGQERQQRVLLAWLDMSLVTEDIVRAFNRAQNSLLTPKAQQRAFDDLAARLEAARGALVRVPAPDRETFEAALMERLAALTPILRRHELALDGPNLFLKIQPVQSLVRLHSGASFVTEDEVVRIVGLPLGAGWVEASQPGYLVSRREFKLSTEDLRLDINLELDRSDAHRRRRLVGLGGLAAVAAGIGVGVYGVVEASDRPQVRNDRYAFIRLFRRDVPVPALDDEAVGEGPLVVGLSAGLIATGTTLFVLGVIDDEAKRPIWVDALISVASGFAVYGLAEAVNAAAR